MQLDNFMLAGETGGKLEMYASMTLIDYIQVWLETFKSGSVKPATLSRLRTSIKALNSYTIAKMPIVNITAIDIQRYVNQLAEYGYGLTTIKKQMRIVTAPLKQAAAMHIIPADPSCGVRLPSRNKVKKPAKSTRAYTQEEQDALWSVLRFSQKPAAAAIGLMLETGLRAGEALALRWKSVDLKNKRLHVEATILNLVDGKRSVLQESPKTESSRRIVPLTPRAIEILTAQKENTQGEWVFEGAGHDRLSYEALRYQTIQLCKKADVEYLGEHVFRHTFATNCYYRHVDIKVLSKILGHADVNVTYNIYINLQGDGFDEMYSALTATV